MAFSRKEPKNERLLGSRR